MNDENLSLEERKDMENNGWNLFSWKCPNCGTSVKGYMNKQGMIKATCSKCKTPMVRELKGKRKPETIRIYPPKAS